MIWDKKKKTSDSPSLSSFEEEEPDQFTEAEEETPYTCGGNTPSPHNQQNYDNAIKSDSEFESEPESDMSTRRRRRRKRTELTPEEHDRRLKVFREEIEPLLPRLLHFALSLTTSGGQPNLDLAQDLVQETCLRAFEALDTYEPGTNIRGWLFTIMRNLYINEYRRRKSLPRHFSYEEYSTFRSEDEEEGGATTSGIAGSDLREEITNQYLSDEVVKALMKLPEEFRLVVLLADFENMKYEEIAKIMGIPIGTVRSRLHRARRLLKRELKDYASRFYQIKEVKRGVSRESRKHEDSAHAGEAGDENPGGSSTATRSASTT